MNETSDRPRRRVCVAVDIQGYTDLELPGQRDAQETLRAALERAASCIGLDRARWARQESGDGELAVLDDDDEMLVVECLPAALSRALREVAPASGLRVRLAVHHGLVQAAANGFAGDGVNEVCRIVNAERVRATLDRSAGANVVVALSERIYSDIVEQRRITLHPSDFQRVQLRNKSWSGAAWLFVPNGRAHIPKAEPDPKPRPGAVTQHATGGAVIQSGRDSTIGSMTTVHGDLHQRFGHG